MSDEIDETEYLTPLEYELQKEIKKLKKKAADFEERYELVTADRGRIYSNSIVEVTKLKEEAAANRDAYILATNNGLKAVAILSENTKLKNENTGLHVKVQVLEATDSDKVTRLTFALEVCREGLKFYSDKKKYFMRKRVINLQETSAVFKVDDPSKLPTEYESEIFECSVAIKVDKGERAQSALDASEAVMK